MNIAIGVLLGVLAGIVLGAAVALGLTRRIGSTNRAARPSALAWTSFALGIAAVVMLASGLLLPVALPGPVGSAINSSQISVVLSVAAITDAVWAIARRDRRWVSWAALIAGRAACTVLEPVRAQIPARTPLNTTCNRASPDRATLL